MRIESERALGPKVLRDRTNEEKKAASHYRPYNIIIPLKTRPMFGTSILAVPKNELSGLGYGLTLGCGGLELAAINSLLRN